MCGLMVCFKQNSLPRKIQRNRHTINTYITQWQAYANDNKIATRIIQNHCIEFHETIRNRFDCWLQFCNTGDNSMGKKTRNHKTYEKMSFLCGVIAENALDCSAWRIEEYEWQRNQQKSKRKFALLYTIVLQHNGIEIIYIIQLIASGEKKTNRINKTRHEKINKSIPVDVWFNSTWLRKC